MCGGSTTDPECMATGRAAAVLEEAAARYENLEAFREAAAQHHVAATATHAAGDITARDAHASSWQRLSAAADAAAA